jgi:serine/threonine-protein kinase
MTHERIGRYLIVGMLGQGGMGVVYRARDEQLGRDVALKVLPAGAPADERARARLMREARLASTLSHPNVCHVYEVGQAEGRDYIAMELVEGRLLREVVPPGGLPAESVLRYGIQIADALAHAHAKGIVHGDLKTANVILTPEGRAKVLDFGLSRRLASADDGAAPPEMTLTADGALLGTPHYLAPEVLRGERAGPASDLWALGVLLYEIAAGCQPFAGNTVAELAAAILNQPPAPLPASVPPGLRAVIQRCLVKEPGERHQQAGEVRAALEALQVGGLPTRPATPVAGRGLVLAAGLVGLVLLVLVLDAGGARSRLGCAAGGPRLRSLAVLPLLNLSGDPGQEYFADGLTDELTAEMCTMPSLRVISRTSAMRYKGTRKSLPEIARELRVEGAVEGSVLRSGDRVRITVQLLDARQDRHLWAQDYERDLRDVLTLQHEVARDVAGQIRLQLTPAARAQLGRGRSVDPVAFEDYLRGRHEWQAMTDEGVRGAIAYFEQALQRDPREARAYTGLADAYVVLAQIVRSMSWAEAYARVKQAAGRALELDEGSPEAHTSMAAALLWVDWDWAGAERHLRRAVELGPSYANAYLLYGVLLAAEGRDGEALARLRQARALDPFSRVVNYALAEGLYLGRHYDEAVAQARRAAEADSGFAPFHTLATRVLEVRGRFPEALESQARAAAADPARRLLLGSLRRGYAAHGSAGYWRADLDWSLAHRGEADVSATVVALFYGQLGQRDSAFAWLARAADEREGDLLFVNRDAAFDPLREDPRFASLMRRIGLVPAL